MVFWYLCAVDILDQVLARAGDDPGVRGVILTGSRARGTATTRSDYDVTIVVATQSQPWQHSTRTETLDEVVCTVDALADTSVHWRRYSYRGATVLLDRLDGGITHLVERQATLSAEEAAVHARATLDAYINQLYRCVKSRRDGATDAALLDEAESLPWLLETVFALHGRLRPYNKYLRWELENFPLPGHWTTALMPDRIRTASLRFFPEVEILARRNGHAEVFDGWGSDIELIRTFAEAAAADRS
ncbi:putative nucleotidyltransferase [Actinoplanes lutulentus]|uniref:Nucleotidyltransferase-like protein n=1 Tax=Actinoplanes lutulentus TaxID=1287878 RepID=A0A327Z345_9ACTN|nr:nucleotidyltransferase domain-containing protein [Actinoplanes lutulentus]MBB2948790.1 putative nucleotidyltransferase [Actinoplanes lutulentus]RAK29702.1 nucleotidyltransferase-like protein [Actinoplanes lutulentus]